MSPLEVVQAWVDAFNRADLEALCAMYAESATNHQVASGPFWNGETLSGCGAAVSFMWLTTGSDFNEGTGTN